MKILKKIVGLFAFHTILTLVVLMFSGCRKIPSALSEEEIAAFNTEFFNGGTDNMNNMLLSSEYNKPQEIDLLQLFYHGIGRMAAPVSEDELMMLTELDSSAPWLDIVKITTDEMDAFLQENLGIGLEETQKTGLDSFYYLEEYDSYYLIVGDSNFDWCTVTSGTWETNNRLTLEYEKEYEGGQWIVTLQKTKDGYLFISNQRADISARETSKSGTDNDMISSLNNRITEKVIENYEDGDISASDIVINQIYYGSFSQDNVSEIFVLCKILNIPHVAGLDKTVGVLLETDTLEMVAYNEFAADKVVIDCIQTSNGQSRILVSKTATYQGISTQEVQLFAIEGSQWVEIPIDAIKTMGEECFCFIGDDLIIVASENKLTSPEEIVAVLTWNPGTEQFVLEQ